MPIFFNKDKIVEPVAPSQQRLQPRSFAEIVAEIKRPTVSRSQPLESVTKKTERNKKTSAYMQDLMNK
jgi:hypothetical protein